MTDTSTADELPPQTNGIDNGLLDEEERARMRPVDIDADVREMERRKRVEIIMSSKLFREELERIIETQLKDGSGTTGLLQQISDMVGVNKQAGNVFKSSSCVIPINDIRGIESMGYAKGEKILRCKLAAVFRLIDLYGWTQSGSTLITARLNQEDEQFLVNPYGMLFHEITASSLIKVDMQGGVLEQGTTNFSVNVTAFSLHAAVHAARPDLRCIIHVHTPSVVAVSALKTGFLPLSQESVVIGEVSAHSYLGGLLDADEKDKLARNLGPINKVLLLSNQGALCCGETIEEAFFNARNTILASESQLKLLPLGVDNLILLNDEARKKIYDAAHRAPESTPRPDQPSILEGKVERKWRVGGVEFEALMRMMDNAGFRTGYIYRHPLVKGEPPKPRNDVEVPPAVSSLGYLLEEEELYRQGLWKKLEGGRKGNDRSRWLNSPNVYQKVEILETGTPDPKKITKWVTDGSPSHSSTPVKIDAALQFVPKGTNPREFKKKQQEIKDYRRADKISAGPQSHILEGVTWEEARKMQDAAVTQTGDHVVLMGAASKGIIQRGHQHNAMVYKSPYAKNPFDCVTDEELEDYKKVVEKKTKGDYDTDYSESEGLSSAQMEKRVAGYQLRSPTSATSETEEESRGESRIIQLICTQAPAPEKPEVVLSDVENSPIEQFLRAERSSVNGYKNHDLLTLDPLNSHYRTNSHFGLPKGSYTVPNPHHFHIVRYLNPIAARMRPLIKTISSSQTNLCNGHFNSYSFKKSGVLKLNVRDTHSVALDISLDTLRAFIIPFATALNMVELPYHNNQSSQTSYNIDNNVDFKPLYVDSYLNTLHVSARNDTETFEQHVLDDLQSHLISSRFSDYSEDSCIANGQETVEFDVETCEGLAEVSPELKPTFLTFGSDSDSSGSTGKTYDVDKRSEKSHNLNDNLEENTYKIVSEYLAKKCRESEKRKAFLPFESVGKKKMRRGEGLNETEDDESVRSYHSEKIFIQETVSNQLEEARKRRKMEQNDNESGRTYHINKVLMQENVLVQQEEARKKKGIGQEKDLNKTDDISGYIDKVLIQKNVPMEAGKRNKIEQEEGLNNMEDDESERAYHIDKVLIQESVSIQSENAGKRRKVASEEGSNNTEDDESGKSDHIDELLIQEIAPNQLKKAEKKKKIEQEERLVETESDESGIDEALIQEMVTNQLKEEEKRKIEQEKRLNKTEDDESERTYIGEVLIQEIALNQLKEAEKRKNLDQEDESGKPYHINEVLVQLIELEEGLIEAAGDEDSVNTYNVQKYSEDDNASTKVNRFSNKLDEEEDTNGDTCETYNIVSSEYLVKGSEDESEHIDDIQCVPIQEKDLKQVVIEGNSNDDNDDTGKTYNIDKVLIQAMELEESVIEATSEEYTGKTYNIEKSTRDIAYDIGIFEGVPTNTGQTDKILGEELVEYSEDQTAFSIDHVPVHLNKPEILIQECVQLPSEEELSLTEAKTYNVVDTLLPKNVEKRIHQEEITSDGLLEAIGNLKQADDNFEMTVDQFTSAPNQFNAGQMKAPLQNITKEQMWNALLEVGAYEHNYCATIKEQNGASPQKSSEISSSIFERESTNFQVNASVFSAADGSSKFDLQINQNLKDATISNLIIASLSTEENKSTMVFDNEVDFLAANSNNLVNKDSCHFNSVCDAAKVFICPEEQKTSEIPSSTFAPQAEDDIIIISSSEDLDCHQIDQEFTKGKTDIEANIGATKTFPNDNGSNSVCDDAIKDDVAIQSSEISSKVFTTTVSPETEQKTSEISSSIFNNGSSKNTSNGKYLEVIKDLDETVDLHTTKHYNSFVTEANTTCDFLKVVEDYQAAVEVIQQVRQILNSSNVAASIDEGIEDPSVTVISSSETAAASVDLNGVKIAALIHNHLIQQGFESKELVVFPELAADPYIIKLVAKVNELYKELFPRGQSALQRNDLRLSVANNVLNLLSLDKRFEDDDSKSDNSLNISDKLFTISEYVSDILDLFFDNVDNEGFSNFTRDLSDRSIAKSTPDKKGDNMDESITAFKKASKDCSECLWFAISPVPSKGQAQPIRNVINIDDIPLRPPEWLENDSKRLLLSPIKEEPRVNLFTTSSKSSSSSSSTDFEVTFDSDNATLGSSRLASRLDDVASNSGLIKSRSSPEINIVVCSEINFYRTRSNSANARGRNVVFTTDVVIKRGRFSDEESDENKENCPLNDSGDWMGFEGAKF